VVRTRKRAQPSFTVGRTPPECSRSSTGVIGEIGIANRALTATGAKQRGFFTSA
jgi:hypothetical protein